MLLGLLIMLPSAAKNSNFAASGYETIILGEMK
jgi:hypothetical protein